MNDNKTGNKNNGGQNQGNQSTPDWKGGRAQSGSDDNRNQTGQNQGQSQDSESE